MKERYFSSAGLTVAEQLYYPKAEVDAEIKRLRGLINWASGKLLDAGQAEAADRLLRLANQ